MMSSRIYTSLGRPRAGDRKEGADGTAKNGGGQHDACVVTHVDSSHEFRPCLCGICAEHLKSTIGS